MGDPNYLTPSSEADLQLFDDIANMLSNPIDDVVNVIRPEILKYLDTEYYMIRPLSESMGCVVLNSDLRNVATGVIAHSVNYFLEDMYFEQ